jgi:hypothetical protein
MITIRPLLAAAFLATALAAGTIAGPAAATTASALAAPTLATTGAATPAADSAHPAPAAAGNCASVRAHPRDYAARGQDRVSCLTTGTPIAHPARVTPSVGYPQVWCDSLTPNTFWVTRTGICVESGITYTLINVNTGAVIGTAQFTFAQQITTSTTKLTWTEADYLTLVAETGAAAGLSVTWLTACSAPCTPATSEPWGPATPIALGETLTGSIALADAPAGGAVNSLTNSYDVTVTQPGATPTGSATWSAPAVRCDNKVAVSNTAGCIIPDYTPVFSVSLAASGSSAAMIEWAQAHLSGHWGLQGSGQPLHRLASTSKANSNRAVICNSTFVSGSTGVATDSCDEFPFAKSYESGALHGVTSGAQCAQVTAIRTAATGTVAQQWGKISVIGTPTGNEKCVRGHIPSSLNSDIGGALGRLTQSQRLIDNDPYWLTVTP